MQTFSTHWKQGVEKGALGTNGLIITCFAIFLIYKYSDTNQSDIYEEAFFAETVNTF